MAFDDDAFRQLLRFLAQQPERLAELRGLVLADALPALPAQLSRQLAEAQVRTEQNLASLTARVDQLAEAQVHTEGRLGQLAEAQARTEQQLASLTARVDQLAERMDQLAARVGQLAEAQARTEQQLASLTARVDQLAERMDQLTARVSQLAERMDQLTARVSQLAERMDQLTARVSQLAERMDQLAARVGQLAERMDQLTAQVDHLAQAQGHTEAALRELIGWQKGEQQRRAGERYEQDILREAFTLFAGGDGGSPVEPHVRARLRVVLAEILASDELMQAEANPTLADVIWWKDGQFAVVEVSLVVDLSDVYRAAQRAETLRKAGPGRGVEAVLPVVIGGHWSGREVREEARRLGVVWWIREGKDVSPEIVAYRRLRATAA